MTPARRHNIAALGADYALFLNVLLEFAPVPEEQPTYVGLGTTLMAPVAFGAPLAAGLLADAAGFGAVFVTATAAGAVALVLLVWQVRDPRHAS